MKIISSLIRSIGVSALLFGSFSGFAAAAPSVVYVSKSNCSNVGSKAGSSSKPYCTIQKAVDSVSNGGTVRVAAGNYPETIKITKSLSLWGAQANRYADSRRTDPAKETVISGTGTASVALMADNISVNGFTITGNTGGPGILSDGSHSGYKVANNIISNNVMGIYLSSNGKKSSVVTRNRLENNNQPGAASGSGIYSDQGVSNVGIHFNSFKNQQNAALVFVSTSVNVINERLQIKHNDTTGPGGFLILVNGRSVTFSQNEGSGFKGSSGIFLGGSNLTVSLTQNKLVGEIAEGVKNAYSGIRITVDQTNYGNGDFALTSNDTVTITHNMIRDFGDAGISIGNPDQAGLVTLVNGTISQNTTQNNGNGEADFDGGILIRSGNEGLILNRNIMNGNTQFDAADYTVGTSSSNTGNIWTDNVCDTSTPGGLCAESSTTATF